MYLLINPFRRINSMHAAISQITKLHPSRNCERAENWFYTEETFVSFALRRVNVGSEMGMQEV